MNNDYQNRLEEVFGNRVKYDEIERRLYSRDSASLPQPMEEMPPYMQKGMDQMSHLPGGTREPLLVMMKGAMPYLMPRMMDEIMPKMIPEISDYLEGQVPHMSDSMKELMPELLPEVMEEIMPAMLPDVLEQVKPEIIEEIRTRTSS